MVNTTENHGAFQEAVLPLCSTTVPRNRPPLWYRLSLLFDQSVIPEVDVIAEQHVLCSVIIKNGQSTLDHIMIVTIL